MHLMILYQNHWTCRIQNRIKILENSRTLDDFIPCQVRLVTIEVLTNPVVSSTFQRRQIQGIQPIPVVTVNRHKFSALDRAIQQATHQELIIHCHLLRTGTPDKTGLVSLSPRPWTVHRPDHPPGPYFNTVFRSEFIDWFKRATLSSLQPELEIKLE